MHHQSKRNDPHLCIPCALFHCTFRDTIIWSVIKIYFVKCFHQRHLVELPINHPSTRKYGNKNQKLTLMLTSKNSAPRDSTCSFTSGRVSKPRTMAPIFLAVPIDDRPATPPPITMILAGGIFPAAVIWPVGRNEMVKKILYRSSPVSRINILSLTQT